MDYEPFVRGVCKTFSVPCGSHADLCLPFFVLEDDEVDVLLAELALAMADLVRCRDMNDGLLASYRSPRPEPRRILDSIYCTVHDG